MVLNVLNVECFVINTFNIHNIYQFIYFRTYQSTIFKDITMYHLPHHCQKQ